jgi:4-amino-4-deoxy-L-arabinose transferase-like glycosyltransferase
LALRLAVVSMVLFLYPRNWLFSKSPDLVFLAQSLVSGRGLSSPFGGSTGPTAFLAPGYPAIVSLVFRLFGGCSFASGAVMMALQTLFAVLTVAIIMDVSWRLFGAPTAILAGAFWAVSPPLIWLPAVLWETSLSILLLIGMVALALRCVDKPGAGLFAVMGAYCSLAMLVNPSLMLSLFAIVGWTIYQTRPPGGHELWMCLLVFLAVFAGWPIRNARVLHAFIPLRSNFGYEVWQGNHPGATGIFDTTIEPLENKQQYLDYAAEGEVAYMRDKGTLARDHIRAHPSEFIKLSAERVARFWAGAGFAVNSRVVELHAVLTSLLGLAGLAAFYRRRREKDRGRAVLFLLPLLVFPLPYYITHAEFRFRLVLDPLLTILGAYAVTRVARCGCSFPRKMGSYRHRTEQWAGAPPRPSDFYSLLPCLRSVIRDQSGGRQIGRDSSEDVA